MIYPKSERKKFKVMGTKAPFLF